MNWVVPKKRLCKDLNLSLKFELIQYSEFLISLELAFNGLSKELCNELISLNKAKLLYRTLF